MKCIIKIDASGNAYGHPYTLDTFLHTFPDLDISSEQAPEGFAWFTRIDIRDFFKNNEQSITQKVKSRYVFNSEQNCFEDEYFHEDLSTEEMNLLIEEIKKPRPGYESWIIDPETYIWSAPIPKPKGRYRWDETNKSWVECLENEYPTPPMHLTALTPSDAIPKPPISNR